MATNADPNADISGLWSQPYVPIPGSPVVRVRPGVNLQSFTYLAMIYRGSSDNCLHAALGALEVLQNPDMRLAPSEAINALGPNPLMVNEKSYYSGIQAQAVGVLAPTPCDRCARGNGRFKTCKVVEGTYGRGRPFLGKGCAGCHHDRQTCTLKKDNDKAKGNGPKSGKGGSSDKSPPKGTKPSPKRRYTRPGGLPPLPNGRHPLPDAPMRPVSVKRTSETTEKSSTAETRKNTSRVSKSTSKTAKTPGWLWAKYGRYNASLYPSLGDQAQT